MYRPKLFSETYGYKDASSVIQLEFIDTTLRNAIWNVISKTFFLDPNNNQDYYSDSDKTKIMLLRVWEFFFDQPIDEFPNSFY